jgi:hypothetical protein
MYVCSSIVPFVRTYATPCFSSHTSREMADDDEEEKEEEEEEEVCV